MTLASQTTSILVRRPSPSPLHQIRITSLTSKPSQTQHGPPRIAVRIVKCASPPCCHSIFLEGLVARARVMREVM
jgi:hypothetical protein